MSKPTCSIKDCELPIRNHRQGWCNKHYLRWRRHGDPLAGGPPGVAGKALEERLWARVDKQGPPPAYRPELGPCWIWQGTVNNNGYGWISNNKRGLLVHRVAYELLIGPIPQGLDLDHRCRVLRCCNPTHLEPVTHQENMRRGARAQQTHCKRGHPFDETNTERRSNGQRRCRVCSQANRRERTIREREARIRARSSRAGG